MFMAYVGYPKKGAFEPCATGTGDLTGATPLWVAAYGANGGGLFGGGMPGATSASGEVLKVLEAGANPHLTTADGTTPMMAAAGMGRATFQPGLQRGRRSPGAGSRQHPARRRIGYQRGERGRLRGDPWRRIPWLERGDRDPRQARRRPQRARLQGTDAAPYR